MARDTSKSLTTHSATSSSMSQKSVLITGCSSGGIGDALALEFHRRGLKVFATARMTSKMQELEAAGIVTIEMDVTDPNSIETALKNVKAQSSGRLDILINNAGIIHFMPFADCTLDDFRRVLETNVIGLLAVTQAFLPLLIAGKGVVANVSSINTALNPPWTTAYNASKSAVNAIGHTLRVELAPFGVRVVTLVTGAVKTKLIENHDAKRQLPEGSMYAPLRDRFDSRDFIKHVKFTPAAVYAKDVANALLATKPRPMLWLASLSSVAWWIHTLGWTGMMDWFLKKGHEFDKLGQSG